MMKKKKKTAPWRRTPEQIAHYEQTMKLLADRIAYHRAKIAEERALREREAS